MVRAESKHTSDGKLTVTDKCCYTSAFFDTVGWAAGRASGL